VEDIKPDIIVLTGDYLNIDYNTDARAISDARNLLSQLKAPYGVYAIPGTRGVDRPEVIEKLFEGLDIHFLRDETEKVELPGGDLYILGLQVLGDGDRWRLQELIDDIPSNAYTLLLYHTPDMAEYASNEGVNLYLAGHTHGGQVRLPGYGALVTFSKFGKKYEMGKYELGHTLMYVSRGIGMEGLGMPRIRFLAPPEVVLVEAGLAR
jgi:uncharacterized protein